MSLTLTYLMAKVNEIESVIQNLEQAMRHAHPNSTNILRRNKEQLTNMLDIIFDAEVSSDLTLEKLIQSHKRCIQDCLSPKYARRQSKIKKTRRSDLYGGE